MINVEILAAREAIDLIVNSVIKTRAKIHNVKIYKTTYKKVLFYFFLNNIGNSNCFYIYTKPNLGIEKELFMKKITIDDLRQLIERKIQ